MKILLLGEWAVGKTCLLKSFIDQKGIGEMAYRYTVGVGIPETKVIQIPCDLSTKTIRMQIWDIAGQPKFAKIGLMYYKEAEGAMFMFDITRPKTLDSLREKWIETCYQNISEDGLRHQIPSLLIGGKGDLKNQGYTNIVSKEEAEKAVKKYRMPYIETSSVTYTNVQEAFVKLAQLILKCIS